MTSKEPKVHYTALILNRDCTGTRVFEVDGEMRMEKVDSHDALMDAIGLFVARLIEPLPPASSP
ncbi:hypothetical protein AB4Z34_23030 [Ensifer sp. 2YAB10]|uniref:hypothetical protein n=1 Tax=unclassified Ensifer TaxID=2633371 RepID=UPI003F8DFD62